MRIVGKRGYGLIAGIFVLALCCFAGGTASALSPQPAEPAEIVYSNGGRILSMKADGSARKVLTGGRNLRLYDSDRGQQDTEPRISPDGNSLLFHREGRGPDGNWSSKYMIASRDGTGVRVLRDYGGRYVYFTQPSWHPDGTEVIFSRTAERGRWTRSSVVAVGLDGGMRTLFKLKPSRAGERNVPKKFDNPTISPDGKTLLVGVSNIFDEYPRLELIDLATGQRRVLAKNAVEGSWSPDGAQVVMSVLDPVNPKLCGGEDCYPARTDIATIDADGNNWRMLYRSYGSESGPRFSADGGRIVFDSSRNFPAGEYSREIYSITPHGGCLTWLTNGTPESIDPYWGPEPSTTSDPVSCGAAGRTAVTELRVETPPRARPDSLIWLGGQSGSMLLSDSSSTPFGVDLEYDDCSSFYPKNCAGPFYFGAVSKCLLGQEMVSFFSERFGDLTVRNGTIFWRESYGKKFHIDFVMTGGSVAYVTSIGRKKAANVRQKLLNLRTIRDDRPVELAGDVKLPAKAIRLLRKVRRAFERTGSAPGAAAALGFKKKRVRSILQADRMISRLGGATAINCPARRPGGGAMRAAALTGRTSRGASVTNSGFARSSDDVTGSLISALRRTPAR